MGAYSVAQAKQDLERLVEAALAGEIVTITQDGRPAVHLTPTRSSSDDDFWDALQKRALSRSLVGTDSVTLVREMREEGP